MKKIIIVVSIVSLISLSKDGYANNLVLAGWETKDTTLELSYYGLHIMDWAQTRYIALHPEEYKETNIILGEDPSIEKIDIYFASTLILHTIISYLLPDNFRLYWQISTISLEGGCIIHNLEMKIPF
jgi:hypothetical protein